MMIAETIDDPVQSFRTILKVIPEHPLSWMLERALFSFSEEKLAEVATVEKAAGHILFLLLLLLDFTTQ